MMDECPFCPAKRGQDYTNYSYHLAKHSPEDLGLYKTARDHQTQLTEWDP